MQTCLQMTKDELIFLIIKGLKDKACMENEQFPSPRRQHCTSLATRLLAQLATHRGTPFQAPGPLLFSRMPSLPQDRQPHAM